nr:uncharacterized protein LOC109160911 [Ipomoea trifida]
MAVVWVRARPNLAEIYTPPAHESSRKPLHTREFPPLNHDQGSGVGDLEAMDSLLLLSRLETSSWGEEGEEAAEIEEERRLIQRLGVFGSEFIQVVRNLNSSKIAFSLA